MTGPTLYRAASADELRIMPLDALTLIYHRASGITHLVAPPVPEIIDTLAGSPMTAAALLDRLAERFALVDPDPQSLVARLDELAAAGLVTRA